MPGFCIVNLRRLHLAYSGYAFAATIWASLMINNKHWLLDMPAGAGIGIISTELVSHFFRHQKDGFHKNGQPNFMLYQLHTP